MCIAERSSVCLPRASKKTADGSAALLAPTPELPPEPLTVPFAALGGLAQQRYETVRSYMLLPSHERPQTSVARFLLTRVERFGMLGLLDRDPAGHAWGVTAAEPYHVEVVPVGTADAHVRAARLHEVLGEPDRLAPRRPP